MTALQRQMLHDFNARPAPRPFGRFTGNVHSDEGVFDAGAWRAMLAAAVCGGAFLAVVLWWVWHLFR